MSNVKFRRIRGKIVPIKSDSYGGRLSTGAAMAAALGGTGVYVSQSAKSVYQFGVSILEARKAQSVAKFASKFGPTPGAIDELIKRKTLAKSFYQASLKSKKYAALGGITALGGYAGIATLGYLRSKKRKIKNDKYIFAGSAIGAAALGAAAMKIIKSHSAEIAAKAVRTVKPIAFKALTK